MPFYTQPNQYSLPTVTPLPAQPNKPTTCNQPVTNPLPHAKKQIREREPRDARRAASASRFVLASPRRSRDQRGTARRAACGPSRRSEGKRVAVSATLGAAPARPAQSGRGRGARSTDAAASAAHSVERSRSCSSPHPSRIRQLILPQSFLISLVLL